MATKEYEDSYKVIHLISEVGSLDTPSPQSSRAAAQTSKRSAEDRKRFESLKTELIETLQAEE